MSRRPVLPDGVRSAGAGSAGTPGAEGVVVRGGAGGTAATLEDLRRAAATLRAAAELLDDAVAAARWVERHGLAPASGTEATRYPVLLALEPAVRGPTALAAGAERVRELAAGLARAAHAYARADDDARDVLRVVLATAGYAAGERPLPALLTGLVLARAAIPGLLLVAAGLAVTGRGPAALRSAATTDPAEQAVQALAGLVAALQPGVRLPVPAPVPGAAGGVTDGSAAAGSLVPALGRRPLLVTPRLDVPRAGPAPRDAADVLGRVAGLYPRSGGAPGTVGVDRLDHPDGTRTWVVAIPGTQASSFGVASNPMDMATNVRLMAGAADDGTVLVTRALEQAGARPGEPVLLAGHSQGGMVAMALAGSAAFTARHRVAAVLTAGSPVAMLAAPRGTAVLHLEHRQDLVPALDGWANPDQPHRTTAVRDLASSRSPADRLAARSPGGAHGIDAYARTAGAVAVAGGPSVRAWERAAGTVLGGPGVTVTHREFSGERAGARPPVRAVSAPRGSAVDGSRRSPR